MSDKDAEKKKGILIELIRLGITDLDSLAERLVAELPTDWDPDAERPMFVGDWFVCMPER